MFPVEITVPGLCHGRLIRFGPDASLPPSADLETSKSLQTQPARPLFKADQTPAVAKLSLPCPRFVQRPSLVEDTGVVGGIRSACKGEDDMAFMSCVWKPLVNPVGLFFKLILGATLREKNNI
jgi:hypothetical protein